MKIGLSRFLKGAAGLAVAAMTLAALPAAAQSVDPAAREALPAEIRDAGVFKVAIAHAWPPFSYQDDQGKLVGLDVDLITMIAAKLGLKTEFEDSGNMSVTLSGVETGRFHTTPSLSITPERAKVVDYVPYFRSQYALLIKKGTTGLDVNNLCGHKLAITQGSSQIALVETLSKECVDAGKEPIVTESYPNYTTTQMAVATGRGEGYLTGLASAVYNAKLNPKLDVAPGLLDKRGTIIGLVVGKKYPELHKAMLLAAQSLEADGSYKAAFEKYDLNEAVLTKEELARPAEEYLSVN